MATARCGCGAAAHHQCSVCNTLFCTPQCRLRLGCHCDRRRIGAEADEPAAAASHDDEVTFYGDGVAWLVRQMDSTGGVTLIGSLPPLLAYHVDIPGPQLASVLHMRAYERRARVSVALCNGSRVDGMLEPSLSLSPSDGPLRVVRDNDVVHVARRQVVSVTEMLLEKRYTSGRALGDELEFKLPASASSFQLSYATNVLSWRPRYVVETLGSGSGPITLYAVVRNTGSAVNVVLPAATRFREAPSGLAALQPPPLPHHYSEVPRAAMRMMRAPEESLSASPSPPPPLDGATWTRAAGGADVVVAPGGESTLLLSAASTATMTLVYDVEANASNVVRRLHLEAKTVLPAGEALALDAKDGALLGVSMFPRLAAGDGVDVDFGVSDVFSVRRIEDVPSVSESGYVRTTRTHVRIVVTSREATRSEAIVEVWQRLHPSAQYESIETDSGTVAPEMRVEPKRADRDEANRRRIAVFETTGGSLGYTLVRMNSVESK